MKGVTSPYPPMEATPAKALPEGKDWWYEPKWDGFRCLAFRNGKNIELQSKAGKSLTRYFPEVVEMLLELGVDRFVLDGELIIAIGKELSFDSLLQRIHPAASRIKKLSAETPAGYVVFDMLLSADGTQLQDSPLEERRGVLEAFAKAQFPKGKNKRIWLSPKARSLEQAMKWLEKSGSTLDGIIAKQTTAPYLAGKREGMLKVKFKRTADCVIGGFRYGSKERLVGSLLLGLYDGEGLLHHVGFCNSTHFSDRVELTKKLETLNKPPGFTGSAPGGKSRWATEKSSEWEPVKPTLAVEVEFDHFSGGRFRHGTKFLRWRPDKKPKQCTIEQVEKEASAALALLK